MGCEQEPGGGRWRVRGTGGHQGEEGGRCSTPGTGSCGCDIMMREPRAELLLRGGLLVSSDPAAPSLCSVPHPGFAVPPLQKARSQRGEVGQGSPSNEIVSYSNLGPEKNRSIIMMP